MSRWRRFRVDIRQAGQAILIASVVLALANAVFYLFLTRPKVFEYRAMTETTAPLNEALAKREAEVLDLEAYVAALERAEGDLVRLREDILATKSRRMIEVEAELEQLTKRFGVDRDHVNYENEILRNEAIERFAIVVPLSGNYQNLRSFIQAVESSAQFLVVEQVGLGRSNAGGLLLQLNITLATYFDIPEQDDPDRRKT